MPAIVLDLLKYLFLIVLYIFVARAVRAVYQDMRPAKAAAAPGRAPARRTKKAPRRAAVIEGSAHKGKTFDLSSELTIGRAEKCHVVLPDDSYVSQVHARIYQRGDDFMVEDLGSTNGTYLNRKRISGPAELQRGDRVKVGQTVLEMRR